MPELPDITIYIEALQKRILDQPIENIRFVSPFVLRTFTPSKEELIGKPVTGLRRIGKRIVFELEDDLFIVIHLMIAGRLKWLPPKGKIPGKIGLAAFDFPNGSLLLTEAGSKRRASIHFVRGESELQQMDPGGIEIATMELEPFKQILRKENHTIKRTLTDPRNFSGIGNAYSDEILHAARMSPIKLTSKLSEEEIERLYRAVRDVMAAWIVRLRRETGEGFPEKVTAFRPDMAVHGKFEQPCPVCGTKIQRIVYADNETNYCARCQTGGKLLADRALSRLLRSDWPKSIDEI